MSSTAPPQISRAATLREQLSHILLDFRQMSEFVENPLIIERASGVRFWDLDGKEYLDGISGVFVASLGYRHPAVVEAVQRQLETLTFAPPLHGVSTTALELVALIRSVAPPGLGTVKLLSGGSEAIESALKFTLQYYRQTGRPQKHKFLVFNGGYHGGTLGALSATGLAARRAPFEPLLPGFLRVDPPYCYRCPFGRTYPECDLFCADEVEKRIETEGPETVAAVLLEPIINTAGIITPPPGYLPRLREICDRHDVLLIFDEVLTGFGRTGDMFAAQTFGVIPDILCVGKGMGGGYGPLSAMIVRDDLAAAFWGAPEEELQFNHGHTFGANPLSCSAGVAVLREMIEADIPARARELGAYLESRLQQLEKFGIVGEVRGRGLLRGVEIVADPAARQPFPEAWEVGRRIGRRALAGGLLLRADPHWFALAPPLITSREDLDRMLEILEGAIQATLEELPR